MEIVRGKVDSAPAFRDEGMRMVQFSQRLVHLGAGAGGVPDGGYVGMRQRGGEVGKAGSRLAAKGDEGVDCPINNRGGLARRALPKMWRAIFTLIAKLGGFA